MWTNKTSYPSASLLSPTMDKDNCRDEDIKERERERRSPKIEIHGRLAEKVQFVFLLRSCVTTPHSLAHSLGSQSHRRRSRRLFWVVGPTTRVAERDTKPPLELLVTFSFFSTADHRCIQCLVVDMTLNACAPMMKTRKQVQPRALLTTGKQHFRNVFIAR